MKEIKKAAIKAAGKKSNWVSEYERQAFIKGFMEGVSSLGNKAQGQVLLKK